MLRRPTSNSYIEFLKEMKNSDETRFKELMEEYIEEYRQFLLGMHDGDLYEDDFEEKEQTILMTESPIERLFYITFKNVIRQEAAEPLTEVTFDLSTQGEVNSHRVDFVMTSFTTSEQVMSTIFIELDGHEYHSSKEQKKSDNKRTRALSSEADAIIRFTGSEVYEDPESCVHESMKVLRKKHNKRRADLWNRGSRQ